MLIFYVLNDGIEDIEKPDEICSRTFHIGEFSGSFLHSSVYPIKHLRSA